MNFPETLKIARKKAGLTQKQLAAKAGLSIATIQGYEQGKYLPKLDNLTLISNILNFRLQDIYPNPQTEISDTTDALNTLNEFSVLVLECEYIPLTPKQKEEIKGTIEKTIKTLETQDGLDITYVNDVIAKCSHLIIEWMLKLENNDLENLMMIIGMYSSLTLNGQTRIFDYVTDIFENPNYKN